MKSEKITLTERLLIGSFNGFLGAFLIGAIELIVVFYRGVTEFSMNFLSSDAVILAAVVFFVLGFLLGPKNMAQLWGKIFGTNRKY